MHGREVKSVRVGAHCPHWSWAASKVPDTPDWGIDLFASSPDHSIQHLTLDRIQFGLFQSCFELWLILVTRWLTGWFHGCWVATPQNSHLLLSAAQNFWWLSGKHSLFKLNSYALQSIPLFKPFYCLPRWLRTDCGCGWRCQEMS